MSGFFKQSSVLTTIAAALAVIPHPAQPFVITATTTTTTSLASGVATRTIINTACPSISKKYPLLLLMVPSSSSSSPSSRDKNTFNPFRMVGDVASGFLSLSLRGGGGGGAADMPKPQVDQALSKISSLRSWSQIRTQLEELMETDEERNFRSNLAKGYGVGSPLQKIRLFDESNREEDIRVTFYRDSASWCPYCQKVWLMLEEKKIPYRVEKINMNCYGSKPASFYRIQPGGQIPVAEIDGRIYGQSNDIMFALEESFTPDKGGYKSLSPKPGETEQQANQLLRLERELFSAWMVWLTRGGSQSSKNAFQQVLDRVEQSLRKTGPFFMGKDVTLVDFMYASFLERMAASLLYFKGFMMRVPPGVKTDYPAVNKWFDAMEGLESYQLTKSDYYTHCWDLPPQLGGCTYESGCEPYEKAINGEQSILDPSRGSWELPLEPHSGGVEPDWTFAGGNNPRVAQREAVERVTGNHEAIVKFACRGFGQKGIPPVSAPLADPNAVPSKAVEPAVDACMRMVCQALLDGDDGKQQEDTMLSVANCIVVEGGTDYAQGVIASLVYVRDRIGVPRDMKFPAARQLRSHLNWAISILKKARDA